MSEKMLYIITNTGTYPEVWDNFKENYKDNPNKQDNIYIIDTNSYEKIVIIKQQDAIRMTDELLNETINELNGDKSIIIVYHENSISTGKFKKFFLTHFSHSGECDVYTEYLLPLSKREIEFGQIWKYLLIVKNDFCNTRRTKILTPFIPFHLYYQLKDKTDEEWKDKILNNAHTKIKEIANGKLLKELLELKTDVNDNEIKKVKEPGVFADLKEFFSHDISECMDNDCNDKIQKFANYLKEVVDSIETGDESQ